MVSRMARFNMKILTLVRHFFFLVYYHRSHEWMDISSSCCLTFPDFFFPYLLDFEDIHERRWRINSTTLGNLASLTVDVMWVWEFVSSNRAIHLISFHRHELNIAVISDESSHRTKDKKKSRKKNLGNLKIWKSLLVLVRKTIFQHLVKYSCLFLVISVDYINLLDPSEWQPQICWASN